jgi:hypothetical protein
MNHATSAVRITDPDLNRTLASEDAINNNASSGMKQTSHQVKKELTE